MRLAGCLTSGRGGTTEHGQEAINDVRSAMGHGGVGVIRFLVAGVKQAFGLHHPGRNLTVYPDDVFIVSYPKSGNTWTRFLIANLVYPEKNPDFSNINDLLPDPEAVTKRDLERAARPRFLKSHQYFDPRFQKVIYIVRDPRDVVLSEYHFDVNGGRLPRITRCRSLFRGLCAAN